MIKLLRSDNIVGPLLIAVVFALAIARFDIPGYWILGFSVGWFFRAALEAKASAQK